MRASLRIAFSSAFMIVASVAFAGSAPAGPEAPPAKPIITEQRPTGGSFEVAVPDREGAVTPAAEFTWDGKLSAGANTNYDGQSGTPCTATPPTTCDITLLNVDVPASYWVERGGGVQISITDYTIPASDFDLYVYQSDAAGTLGPLVGSSAGSSGEEESTSIREGSGYYLIQVVYWAVAPASSYTGTAAFSTRFKIPIDVDTPTGLQEILASDPTQGWRSHSEMHVAQSPVNPNLLVAGSKFYNKDLQDSIAEYEFKIGTYVSFDQGQTWTSLGQVNVCPASQAPPESWPLENTCYPADDPNMGGTEEEDVDDPDVEGDPADPRGSTDYGEEYIVSDPWVGFDDEGNAYLMVLDSPPYEGDLGWGMSFHRWESVSQADVLSGNTWSNRIIINAYPDEGGDLGFLDDKNTFTVNTAGPDGDGDPGIMVACWGQNINELIKQQTVCERSTDGGMTWPDEPQVISPPDQQLVIGVNVVGDTVDPETFYAMWQHYTPSLAGEPSEMWFSKSTDGGESWSDATLATTFTDLPTQLPNQNFRNLSIPIIGVGYPSADEPAPPLYAVYSDYVPNDDTTDEDQMDGDVVMITSDDGGDTWSDPVRVNQDTTSADQFQGYIVVTKSGQLNVAYFDRRLDYRPPPADPPTDTDNYFVDVWLNRSNDGGTTWTETRLSHDSIDPELNAPVSGSGLFFGDYQGLVADDCVAIPFVNDSHLANDTVLDPGPVRDPEFDDQLPSSPYQEATSWRVPNTSAFGGAGSSLPAACTPPPVTQPGDVPCPSGATEAIIGTNGRDLLIGTRGRDVICGGSGNDTIRGTGGKDLLLGGTGKDRLSGGAGNDTLKGGAANDVLAGGGGKDKLRGGGGKDKLSGGAKLDRCAGGPGVDRVRAC